MHVFTLLPCLCGHIHIVFLYCPSSGGLEDTHPLPALRREYLNTFVSTSARNVELACGV